PVLPTDLARSNEVSVLPYEKQRTYPADAVAVVVCNSAVCNSAVCNSASAAPLVLREDDELPAFEALALELPAPQLSALSQSTRLSLDQQSEQLKTAVCKNDWGAVKDLLSAGVRVQSKNWYDTPVLVLAAQNASNDIVMALIQAGASVNSGYDRLPLNVASERGDFEVVHMLMRAGAYLEATEENGFTALMCAAAAGHLLIVQTLIACGANVNANYYGKTPLMLAARNGHTKVYDFLYAYMQQDPPEDNRQQQQAMVGAQHSQLDRELYSMFESQIEPEQSR
ncbi:MAG: ankyrin repeat domain-containing protein, partial [Cyanobacteria bacterium J06598_3]